MAKVGFTGTRVGIYKEQKLAIRQLLAELDATEFHHGDCIGADASAHEVAIELDIPVHLHPPHDSKARAWCEGAAVVHPVLSYLTRNHEIVDSTDVLIACPASLRERLRSGTWATIRYARKVGRPIIVIGPDGKY